MTKLQITDLNGNKGKEISSEIFDGKIRLDLVQKIAETEKEKQPYAPYLWAGMESSASGNVKHNRHVWKTDRGKGLSRYPKKRMSDKGSNFVWVAAIIPGVRGGRRAHPPKLLRRELKINQKEKIMGFLSALAMVASNEEVKKKYSRLNDVKELNVKLPLIVDSKITSLKSKEFFNALEKILGNDLKEVAIQDKKVRAGRGKMRNRTYKKNAGLLLVIGNSEKMKISGVDLKQAKEVKISDLASNGARLVMFTESAVKDLELKLNKNK
ncbi:MAG: 50S ribosomal protein L4, partial [archaeon]|nr:50S ribosomal protein L4 [archaeon]